MVLLTMSSVFGHHRRESHCKRDGDCIGQQSSMTTIIILVFILCHLPRSVTGFEPGFISPLENITVAAGRSAQFTCVVKHLGGHKVAWLRSDSKAILAIHTHMVTNNPRMSVSHNGHNSWTMSIDVVQRNDSGLYMCQINTEPMTSQVGILNVVEAPDILYNETSNDTIVAEGASVALRCEARGYPEPTVTWRREDGAPIVLRNHQTPSRLQTVEGNELELNGLTRSDMGAYLCIASNGIPSPVSKRIMVHVHFHPLIKVHEQIVMTTLGSTVTLICGVEASPKAVHFWNKYNGPGRDEISINSPSGRFRLSEDSESLYSYVITLTIHGVKESDLGNYTCGARNSYGTVKGAISLEKMSTPNVMTTNTPQKSYNEEEEDRKRKRKQRRRKLEKIYEENTSTEDPSLTKWLYRTPPTYKYQDSNTDEGLQDGEDDDKKISFFSSSSAPPSMMIASQYLFLVLITFCTF